MRFTITMNMPSRNGGSVHQIVCDHQADNIEQFTDTLNEYNFVIVDEVYKDNDAAKKSDKYYSVGPLTINTSAIGKVKMHSV